ncbi:glycosyltransferase, partial [Oscillospiraceae bacterium OttesenSCG-928-F05]|nr:glycosyltransferase [Oscillospiraceae bacterium OttesenSCG-928-F05]
MRIVFTCGGTGGHINPALAVAKLVRARRPESAILFVGAKGGMEEELVAREGFAIETVEISNFRRSFKPRDLRNNVRTLGLIRRSVRRAGDILDAFGADIVVGTGGYASFPVVRAAQKRGLPTVIHESNASPGLTTVMLAKKATRVLVSFEESAGRYPHPDRVRVTGTPVRQEFVFLGQAEEKAKLGMDGQKLIVSYWGSLGAREMNKKIAD